MIMHRRIRMQRPLRRPHGPSQMRIQRRKPQSRARRPPRKRRTRMVAQLIDRPAVIRRIGVALRVGEEERRREGREGRDGVGLGGGGVAVGGGVGEGGGGEGVAAEVVERGGGRRGGRRGHGEVREVAIGRARLGRREKR